MGRDWKGLGLGWRQEGYRLGWGSQPGLRGTRWLLWCWEVAVKCLAGVAVGSEQRFYLGIGLNVWVVSSSLLWFSSIWDFFSSCWQIFSKHTIPNSFKEIGTLLSTIIFSFLQVTFSLGKLKCCCMFFL